jgi:large subunit ribosomal protein L30e
VFVLETIDRLPEGRAIIGAKEVAKAAAEGKIGVVVVASNCPEEMIKKIGGVEIKRWVGDRASLGTALGKPFPISIVGFEKK